VMDEIKGKNLCKNAEDMGKYLLSGLKKIAKAYPEKIAEARGVGLMIGVLFKEPFTNLQAASALRENGLILIPAGSNALRFLPPLNVKKSEADSALKIFEKTVAKL
ncbi:MAG: aminotransferase class III-fold pyridoxal phosphate-dependent enzyme, partial [Opitutales bacterium]|nr:aminotransferase class III-fold pyridoxal phosphate-dependent enzyme [Opitutales bacterium]